MASSRYLFHEIHFIENGEGFDQRGHQRTEDDYRDRELELMLAHRDGQLRVGYEWSRQTGLPWRHTKEHALLLEPGEYGRFVVNGRHTGESNHFYTQETFNITLLNRVTSDAFTSREPDKVYSMEEDLF